MEHSVINVKQIVIYNIGHELYVILQLISCCCWKNFIDLNLWNEPNKQTIIFFLSHSKNWNFFLTHLLGQFIFLCVPQFQAPVLL